jgi:hypothetical protein
MLRCNNLIHLQRFYALKDPSEVLPQTDEA